MRIQRQTNNGHYAAVPEETRVVEHQIIKYTYVYTFSQNAADSIRILFIFKISLGYKNRARTAFD